MPELPDVVVYLERWLALLGGQPLERLRIASPFLLRTVDPPPTAFEGRTLRGGRRMGKRLVMDFGDAHFMVLHLMVAGRLRWRERGKAIPRKRGLAAFDFPDATLLWTEEGTKKRASLHLVRGQDGLAEFDRGGLEVLETDPATFREMLRSERHTLKRALTDPRLFSGIGGAFSDEMMHAAGLSPVGITTKLDDAACDRLFAAARETLERWTQRLRDEVGDGFPEKVTAFRKGMAVHGRYRKPCPVCEAEIQRIVYVGRETNYCPICQTGGRILADRALSRLLKADWPRSLEELERSRSR